MPTMTVEDLSIHYLHNLPAEPGSGQRVLFIHGTGCNARVFERHMRHLADNKHEVVTIDLSGHGQSAGSGFRGVADHAAFCAGRRLVPDFDGIAAFCFFSLTLVCHFDPPADPPAVQDDSWHRRNYMEKPGNYLGVTYLFILLGGRYFDLGYEHLHRFHI